MGENSSKIGVILSTETTITPKKIIIAESETRLGTPVLDLSIMTIIFYLYWCKKIVRKFASVLCISIDTHSISVYCVNVYTYTIYTQYKCILIHYIYVYICICVGVYMYKYIYMYWLIYSAWVEVFGFQTLLPKV